MVEKRVIGNATLYLGDCLQILPTLPKVDAVITDPPYGIDHYRHGGGFATWYPQMKGERIIGDKKPFDPIPLLALNVKTIMWGANHYADKLPPSAKWLVWDKRCGGTPDDNADAEMAWTNCARQLRIHRQVWRGAIRQGEENVSAGVWRQHPNQKPIGLMRWCISHVGDDSDLILDPYVGSGTTGVACMQFGRKFIGIEIEPKYYEIACERIENAQRQVRMDFA